MHHVLGLQAALLLLVTTLIAGCGPSPAEKTRRGGDIGDLGGHVKRGVSLQQSQNDLRQLAQFCHIYRNEHNRLPKVDELKDYIRREAPQLAQALEQGRYVIVADAKPESASVLAYEKEVDLNGNQGAVMGDGSYKLMKAEALQAALRKRG